MLYPAELRAQYPLWPSQAAFEQYYRHIRSKSSVKNATPLRFALPACDSPDANH